MEEYLIGKHKQQQKSQNILGWKMLFLLSPHTVCDVEKCHGKWSQKEKCLQI